MVVHMRGAMNVAHSLLGTSTMCVPQPGGPLEAGHACVDNVMMCCEKLEVPGLGDNIGHANFPGFSGHALVIFFVMFCCVQV